MQSFLAFVSLLFFTGTEATLFKTEDLSIF